MKAVDYTTFGPPEVLHLQGVEKPKPKDISIIYASSIAVCKKH